MASLFRWKKRAGQSLYDFFKERSTKLHRWMHIFEYKAIHAVFLEAVYVAVYDEAEAAPELRAIRSDRGWSSWEAIKEFPTQKRAREKAAVHERHGPHVTFDTIFRQTLGDGWRGLLDAAGDKKTWAVGKTDFVKRACAKLRLPKPYPMVGKKRNKGEAEEQRNEAWEPSPAEQEKAFEAATLLWDSLFKGDREIEIITDNETVAGLLNVEINISNKRYAPVIHRVRGETSKLFGPFFRHKAGFLAPFDWRPRELITAPDYVCKFILAKKADWKREETSLEAI